MIIVCQNCSSRFQLDDAAPPRPTAKCPKCNKEIAIGPSNPAAEKSALALGGSPSTEVRRFEHSNPAPLFEIASDANGKQSVSPDLEKFVQMMTSLLGQNSDLVHSDPTERPSWNKRKALVCAPEDNREKIARLLTQKGFQVFVATDTKQAVERMRENQLDVVLLDPQFDSAEQGAAFVVREVNVLRPSQRRRLFFVLLSPSLRTMDAHGAFLNNVNSIINLKDIDDLSRILDHGLREFNELYKDFNSALQLTSL